MQNPALVKENRILNHKFLYFVLILLFLAVGGGSISLWNFQQEATRLNACTTADVIITCAPVEDLASINRAKKLVKIYFNSKTQDSDIIFFKELIEKQTWAQSVDYVSEQTALDDYKLQHYNNPLAIESIDESADSPIRATMTISLIDASQKDGAMQFIKLQAIYPMVDILR